MKIQVFGNTIIGKVRDHNEDSFLFSQNLEKAEFIFNPNDALTLEIEKFGSIMCVADGMGGTNAGEIASYEAIQFVKNYFSDKSNYEDKEIKIVLIDAIKKTNEHLINYITSHPESKGMGTTIVLSIIKDDELSVAWTGDSRCYIMNASDEESLFPFTDDHSMVWELVQANKMSSEQARVHPNSNIITQSLGDSANKPNPSFKSTRLKNGDKVILCSDGLNGMISDQTIQDILSEEGDAKQVCNKLINKANEAGGEDNITVIVSKILEVNDPNAIIEPWTITKSIIKNEPNNKLNKLLIPFTAVIVGLIIGLVFGYFIFGSDDESQIDDISNTKLIEDVKIGDFKTKETNDSLTNIEPSIDKVAKDEKKDINQKVGVIPIGNGQANGKEEIQKVITGESKDDTIKKIKITQIKNPKDTIKLN